MRIQDGGSRLATKFFHVEWKEPLNTSRTQTHFWGNKICCIRTYVYFHIEFYICAVIHCLEVTEFWNTEAEWRAPISNIIRYVYKCIKSFRMY